MSNVIFNSRYILRDSDVDGWMSGLDLNAVYGDLVKELMPVVFKHIGIKDKIGRIDIERVKNVFHNDGDFSLCMETESCYAFYLEEISGKIMVIDPGLPRAVIETLNTKCESILKKFETTSGHPRFKKPAQAATLILPQCISMVLGGIQRRLKKGS